MEEIGIVKSIEGPFAKVLVQRKSVCDKCTAGTCHLMEEGAELDALNEAKAQVGQKVKVVLRPFSYLKGSLIAYGMPALALILGAVLGREVLAQYFTGMDPDSVSAIFAFGAFALSFLIVKVWSTRAEKRVEYKPVVEQILTEE
jgi:positive regulator of sigma E activity